MSTGTAVLLAYRVRDAARASGYQVGELTGRTLVAIGALVLLVVTALGPPPQVNPSQLRTSLIEAGFASADLQIRLVIGGSRFCPAHGSTCEATVASH